MVDNSNHRRRRAGRLGGIDCNNTSGWLKEHMHTGFEIRLSCFYRVFVYNQKVDTAIYIKNPHIANL